MTTGLIDIMKRAAIEADDSRQPSDLRIGTVSSVKPLKVKITNQFILPESLLIVPEHLTDHDVKISLGSWRTSSSGDHSHVVEGEHTITIHNALKTGDKVALLRKRGGQSYFILDRI